MICLYYISACAVPSCRSIYLSMNLSNSCYGKCATPSCHRVLCVVFGRVVILCVFVLVIVDRAVEPVERVTYLNVAIASSSRHGRSAKHVPSLVLSLFFLLLFA